jgi:hypothetical protein
MTPHRLPVVPERLEDAPLLVQLLAHLSHFPRRRRESDAAWVTRWLTESELGSGLAGHLLGEAELLEMAANRLNLSGDEELREMGHELARMATRLQHLLGTAR